MKGIIAIGRKTRAVLTLALAVSAFPTISSAQDVNVKTNTLYWATTTPNLGMEFPLGARHSGQVFFGLNPWKQGDGNHSSLRHWMVMPEWRYWFCQRYNGWFLGVHALGGQYNANAVDLPFGLLPSLADHRYKGWYVGGGVAMGYQWALSRHWALEAELGVGYIYSPNDKYCANCNTKLRHKDYNYVGPTKAALSIVYFLGGKKIKGRGPVTYGGNPVLLASAGGDERANEVSAASIALEGNPVARLANNEIRVMRADARPQGSQMLVTVNMNLDSLRLRKSNQLVYTPILYADGDTLRLPEIVLNSRRENVLYRRGDFNGRYADGAIAVGRKNGKAQNVNYVVSVPMASKPRHYSLGIQEDLCGCGDIENDSIYKVYTGKPLEPQSPMLAYVKPAVEAGPKIRQLNKRAYIDFPVDRTELHPDYRRNPEQLDSIVNTINVLKSDPSLTVTSITVHGYASPESPYQHNAMLAEGRAKTLTDYVRRMVDLPRSLFAVNSTPEDWEGLRNYLRKSSLAHRDEILAISSDTRLDPDAREWKIKSTYPEEYKYMLQNWYPALRHSDYQIKYVVKAFDLGEAKQVIRTAPQNLSLSEMYMVAQTYMTGSKEFNDVMETAVRFYPDDPTANLNAAIERLNALRPDEAKPYLDKAGNSPAAEAARKAYAELKQQMTE